MSFGIFQNYTIWSSDCPIMYLPILLGSDHESISTFCSYKWLCDEYSMENFIPIDDQFLSSEILHHKVRTLLSLLTHIARACIPATRDDACFVSAWPGLSINRRSKANMGSTGLFWQQAPLKWLHPFHTMRALPQGPYTQYPLVRTLSTHDQSPCWCFFIFTFFSFKKIF